MNTLIIVILTALTFAFALACILLRRKNKSFEGMVCKFMASFGFIGVAVAGNYIQQGSHIAYFSFVLIALLFGFCGDIYLGVKEIAPLFRKKLIPIGTAFFLVGHIFYIIAFTTVYGMEWKTLIAFACTAAFAFALVKVLKMKIGGAFATVCCAYYGLLGWKIAICINMIMHSSCTANIFAMIGSCLFLISDTCIGILYFTPVKKKNGLVTAELSTYYTAQILLALSVAVR
ncbi:MAG: hypothetical protein IKS39_05535 [Clostridia bacterium]|nr:hypothetical protein [Clostridia bacterium]